MRIAGRAGETLRHSSAEKAGERLMKACREVEGLFINQLMSAMSRPTWDGGALGGSPAEGIFHAQRDRALAEEMGRSGSLGLAEMLFRDLSMHERPDALAVSESTPSDKSVETEVTSDAH
ncbi:MAG: hypothetical protein GX131_07150 [candidate division WS1 bacterium]|nr:hypothetical protein [candidate division WS1 bacterium]